MGRIRGVAAAGLLLAVSGGHAVELPFGVASGEVSQDSALLWARASAAGDMTFEISSTSDFAALQGSFAVGVADTGVAAKLVVDGLQQATRYWYRATDVTGAQSVGTFVTAPVGGNSLAGVRFGVTGDWQAELRPYAAVANVPDRQLDFLVKLGDTIYAENYFAAGTPTASTLAEYRAKYDLAMTPVGGVSTWQGVNASTAVWAMIDDHEVVNDFQGGANPATDPVRFPNPTGAATINQTARYQAGLQAFQENMPIDPVVYAGTGDPRVDGVPNLYRSQVYGNAAAVMMLDARSFRDVGLPDANPVDPVSVGTYLATSLAADRTMLGAPQLAALKQDLLSAQQDGVTWKFVMLSEPIQNLGVLNASDRYEGYARERADLLAFIHDEGIRNVVFVSADIHGSLVNEVNYRETPFGPDIFSGAFEITTGPVGFDAPFGPTVVGLANALGLSSITLAQYAGLPEAQKEAVLRQIVDGTLAPLGYDPLGLQNPALGAELLAGGYTVTNAYGWTEFDIEPGTRRLLVTTYGIDYIPQDVVQSDPAAVAAMAPRVLGQFAVTPVPEPRTFLLLAAGLAGLSCRARKGRR